MCTYALLLAPVNLQHLVMEFENKHWGIYYLFILNNCGLDCTSFVCLFGQKHLPNEYMFQPANKVTDNKLNL